MTGGEFIKLLGPGVRGQRDGGWLGRCPAHEDRVASMSVKDDGQKVLVHCHAGCTIGQICAALKIEVRDLFHDSSHGAAKSTAARSGSVPRIVSTYDYTDENGQLLFQVLRYEPKGFKQRRPSGKGGWTWNLGGVCRVLYRLHEVLRASNVLIVEGEKDVETARGLSLVATCNPGGAGKWREEYGESLRGKQVTIISDADEPGRNHSQQVAQSLYRKAVTLKVLEFAGVKDLTEWVERGGTRDSLLEQIRTTPEWKPVSESPMPKAGVVLRRVSDIERKDLRWLWHQRVPLGKLTLFAGDPGLGKSFVTLDMAARVTRGAGWPDGAAASCEAGSVILLSAEDDAADTIRPRLEAAGADLSKVHILQAVRRLRGNDHTTLEQFSLETDLVALQDAVVSLGDVRLIGIDPLSAYLGGIDSHVNSKVRSLLSPLAEIASTLSVAVVGVTHLNKTSSSALYRASGSIAFVAAARAVWFFGKHPDDPAQRLMLPGKMNLGPEQEGMSYRLEAKQGVAVVAWGDAVSVSADAVLEQEGNEQRSERLAAIDWLRERLADGPVPQRKIKGDAKAEGFSWATLRRAKDALGVVTEKTGYQGSWQWRLKDGQAKGAQPYTSEESTFEQATENTNLNGNRAAKDAQANDVSFFDVSEADGEVRL